jgi:hypothetical protein
MKNSQFLPATYLFNVAILLVMISLTLNHIPASQLLFGALVTSQFFYVIPCMVEVNRSTRIPRHEKTTWIIGLLFITVVAGGIYIFSARKRIANQAVN